MADSSKFQILNLRNRAYVKVVELALDQNDALLLTETGPTFWEAVSFLTCRSHRS
jgi:hypothetical protein